MIAFCINHLFLFINIDASLLRQFFQYICIGTGKNKLIETSHIRRQFLFEQVYFF